MSECCCCPNKAKYDVEGDKACGVHLATIVRMHLEMTSRVNVNRIEDAYEWIPK